jgi:hypothetical protein
VFQEEIFEAGAFAGLAEDGAIAEEFGDGADDRDDLMGMDESVEADGEVGFGGEAACYAEGEAEGGSGEWGVAGGE